MTFTNEISIQGFSDEDRTWQGATFEEVWDAISQNPYCQVWGSSQRFRYPVYPVTLGSVTRGIYSRTRNLFKNASRRTVDSQADLRWGPDLRGQRRLLHPNGICLSGIWKIDEDADSNYSGYFQPGSRGRIIARYSTCCTETRRNHYRSLSMVGKIYPLESSADREVNNADRKPVPASFITQEDLGGTRSNGIHEATLRNAPNTTFWRRGWGFPILILTGLTFKFSDREVSQRQLYQIAELENGSRPVRTPQFMQLNVSDSQEPITTYEDFRDEIMAHIFEPGNPDPQGKLKFDIEVSDTGKTRGPMLFQRRIIPKESWNTIGSITFDNAVVSYNGDFVIHFHHPKWRKDRNDSATIVSKRKN